MACGIRRFEMSAIMDAFASKPSLLAGKGAPAEQISQAEQDLGLSFSEEYREYLSSYGIVAFDGHEMTGLSKSKRLDVVSVTADARNRYPDLPSDLYVIEETGVEELIILQNATGEVFGCAPNYPLEKVCDSLSDYVLGKRN